MADVPDPFKPPDATIMRPRPGAGRRSDAGPRQAPSPETVAVSLAPVTRASAAPGLNPLIQAASPLLLIAGQLRNTLSAPDVAGLRRHTLEEIRRFEERSRSSGLANEVVVAARYVLCAGLDESVLSTPWGAQSEWAQQSLLIALHREASGGEKFFEMLDRLMQDPARHLDLMELQYLCLAFGFAGKYQVQDRGHVKLAEIQQELYRQIRSQRGAASPELSLRWRGLEDRRNPLIRYVPWWVVGAAALAVLSITFFFYLKGLGDKAAPIQASLNMIGLDRGTAARPAPARGQSLAELLKDQVKQGTLTVVESSRGTVVTVTATDLFASGSARVATQYAPLLEFVGSQLEKVSGNVIVVGHTDNQPISSYTFANNLQLSKARADSVVSILGKSISNKARVESTGAGDRDPLPNVSPSDPRNRRVEIILYGG